MSLVFLTPDQLDEGMFGFSISCDHCGLPASRNDTIVMHTCHCTYHLDCLAWFLDHQKVWTCCTREPPTRAEFVFITSHLDHLQQQVIELLRQDRDEILFDLAPTSQHNGRAEYIFERALHQRHVETGRTWEDDLDSLFFYVELWILMTPLVNIAEEEIVRLSWKNEIMSEFVWVLWDGFEDGEPVWHDSSRTDTEDAIEELVDLLDLTFRREAEKLDEDLRRRFRNRRGDPFIANRRFVW